jgi:hypothetical protein
MLNQMSFESLSASVLLRSLTTNDHHPHMLLDCNPWEVECVLLGLAQWGTRPVRHCRFPGPLLLPRYGCGTLLLEGLHSMNLTQQLALYDWMTNLEPDVQIISIAYSDVIESMVAKGEFLEGLFTRLSSVRLNSRAHDARVASRIERSA